jgi:tetratricopeptide (TPR) repeat protein
MMSRKPDTWMICPDTLWDHCQCGLRSSANSYRFAEAEKHFRRALELGENHEPTDTFTTALIAYAQLLLKMKRPREAVEMYERRLALKHFPNEDRLERQCTAEHLASLKAELAVAEEPPLLSKPIEP